MERMLPILILLFWLAPSLSGKAAMAQAVVEGTPDYHIGVTMGTGAIMGLDISRQLSRRCAFRAGFQFMHFRLRRWETDFNRFPQKASIDLDVEHSAFSFLIDYNLNRSGFFRLVSGIGLFLDNQFATAVKLAEPFTFNDIDFEPDELGYVYGGLSFKSSICPYIGLGLGRIHGKKRRVSISADLGTYYKGPPQIQVGGTNLLQNNEHNSEVLTDNFSAFRWFPVLNFRLNYSINPVNH
jgi:hypothetical protein